MTSEERAAKARLALRLHGTKPRFCGDCAYLRGAVEVSYGIRGCTRWGTQELTHAHAYAEAVWRLDGT